MKIRETGYRGKSDMQLNSAVQDALTPSAYSYSGQISKLEVQIEKLQELVVRLVEVVINEEGRYSTDPIRSKVEHILGCGYKVEEE